jgi:hypothetical protein
MPADKQVSTTTRCEDVARRIDKGGYSTEMLDGRKANYRKLRGVIEYS